MTMTVTDLTAFNETEFLAAVESAAGEGNSATITSIAFKVKFSTTISAVISEYEGRQMLATSLSVPNDTVDATVTYSRRMLEEVAPDDSDNLVEVNYEDAMDRRLQAAYTSSSVDATITATSATAAQAVKQIASDPNVSAAMATHLATAFNKTATISVGAITTQVEVITTVVSTSGNVVPEFTGDVLNNLTANIAAMPGAGVTLDGLVDTTPTPSPPTAAPTAAAPTAPPTATPTAAPPAPTVAPTAAGGGDDVEDSACVMGAKALALAAAAFALRAIH
jgi:hypothetical protein